MRVYIQRFSQKCDKLTKICDANVVSTFWSDTLVHELGHYQPKTTKELLNIATTNASGDEAVGAIFIQNSRKAALAAIEECHPRQPTRALRGVPKATKGGQSHGPSESRSPPATMRVTTTRMLATLMRSSSLLLSMISSARRSSPLTTLRSFSRQPVPITHTPSGTN
jgi:hypothetical protein